MSIPTLHYGIGARFVLAVDMIYPWATFPMLNTYDLFEKNSAANAWWIGVVACTDLAWTLVSLIALFFTCCCSKVPRRVDLILRAWFISSTLGVLIHVFCTAMSAQWVLLIFSLILRLPYCYMVFLYWFGIRKLSRYVPTAPTSRYHHQNASPNEVVMMVAREKR